MDAILIRPYTKDDRKACMDCFKSNVPDFFTEGEITEFENFLQRLPEQQIQRTYFYVITQDDRIVGCGGFGDKDGNQVISLTWGHIHKDFHRKGLGGKLLAFRLNEIGKIFPGLPLVIDTTQFSAPFYEKHGFVVQKITENYYAPGMDRHDMIYHPAPIGEKQEE